MRVVGLICLGITYLLAEQVQNNLFTANLYKTIAKRNPETFLVSPLSAKLGLALAQMGAKDETARQLGTVLGLPQGPNKFKNFIRKLLLQLKGTKDYELKSVNKIYIANNFTIKDQYKRDAVNFFKTDIRNIDFGEAAVEEINNWVEEQTNKKIKNIVSPEIINSFTALLLINAMYFHGKWVYKFDKTYTKMEDFHTSTKSISVEMMSVTARFNYYRSEKYFAQFLELPYKGKDITMTFVLPDTIEGLTPLEDNIIHLLVPVTYSSEEVQVFIPKFKIDTKIQLKPILNDMGVTLAFSSNANFEGISSSELSIGEVIQKSFIEIDEEGTTASAASIIDLVSRTRSVQMNFNADHPFIFFLKSKNEILFIGRYTGP